MTAAAALAAQAFDAALASKVDANGGAAAAAADTAAQAAAAAPASLACCLLCILLSLLLQVRLPLLEGYDAVVWEAAAAGGGDSGRRRWRVAGALENEMCHAYRLTLFGVSDVLW
jgi:hypothetical protein